MSYFNEEQQSYMKYLATLPREQLCASGWHIVAKEQCDCGPYKPCAIPGCKRTRLASSEKYCYEHKQILPEE